MKPSQVLKGILYTSDTKDRIQIVPNGYVVSVEGICKGIFTKLPKEYAHLPIQDYGNQMIIPGLVDLHLHAPQAAFRGTGMDLELMDWLKQSAFPEETRYGNLAYAMSAYEIFVKSLRNSATTRASIFATRHTSATIQLMEFLEESGLCTYVGKVNMNRNAPEQLVEKSTEESIQETKRWLTECQRFSHTKPILTPRFLPSCTDDLMEELGHLQGELDLPVQSHLSENPAEVEFVKEICPTLAFYGEGYDRVQLFGWNAQTQKPVPTIMAHCIYSSKEEIERMRQQQVYVAHCPTSNLDVSSGLAPIRKYLDQGLRVGLGTDVAGGHSDSIFHTMVDAINVSKMYWRYLDSNAKPLTFPEVFYLATKGGGSFFGKVGAFEEGYAFDAVVLEDSRYPSTHTFSDQQRLERFVYLQGDDPKITAKYVDGVQLF